MADSIPNKPIEYLAAGLPVITSIRGHLERLLVDASAGACYGWAQESELAAILAGLAQEPQRVQQMKAAARALHARLFSADQVYGELAASMEALAGQVARTRVGLPRHDFTTA